MGSISSHKTWEKHTQGGENAGLGLELGERVICAGCERWGSDRRGLFVRIR